MGVSVRGAEDDGCERARSRGAQAAEAHWAGASGRGAREELSTMCCTWVTSRTLLATHLSGSSSTIRSPPSTRCL
jgi:hypothetical protein